jgi:hypothetical protein
MGMDTQCIGERDNARLKPLELVDACKMFAANIEFWMVRNGVTYPKMGLQKGVCVCVPEFIAIVVRDDKWIRGEAWDHFGVPCSSGK